MTRMKDAQGNDLTDAAGKVFYIHPYTQQNFDFAKTKVITTLAHRRMDFFCMIDGPVGTGKTTLSFQCAKYFDPTFDLSRVVFNVEDFLRVLVEAKPGQAVVFDEAIVVNSRSALTEFNKKIIIAMTQIRSKGLFIFFNIPSIFDLDRNLVLNRAHLLLHCFSETFGDRGKYVVFDRDKLKQLYLKGKRLYSYNYPKANFTARFGEYFPMDRNNYEKKKQAEIAKQAKPKKIHRWNKQRNNLVRYIWEIWPGKDLVEEKAKKIADLCGDIDGRQVKEIIYERDYEEND